MPVVLAVSQSTLPQAQAALFAEDPSVIEHAGGREHVLVDASHNNPVPAPASFVLQSALPQAQADGGLAAEPSVVAQVGIARHLFWDR